MADEQKIDIVHIDCTYAYRTLHPHVQHHCNRPRGAYEAVAALAMLLGDIIGKAPSADIQAVLEQDAALLIKRHIVLTQAAPAEPPAIELPTAPGRH